MSYESDQERLIATATQIAGNAANVGVNLASMRKPKLKIEVKTTAQDDLSNVRSALKEGLSIDKIKENLSNSPEAQKIAKAGRNVSQYVSSIVQKAKIDNAMEQNPSQGINLQKTQQQENTRER